MIRVLIVDDSVTQREILKRLLNNDGLFTVVAEARNGSEAIAKVLEYKPDVVLMDIHMPDMDGIEATREIMRQCPVPIVVASATLKKRDVNLALSAIEAGAVSVIAKPAGAVLLHLQKIGPNLRDELLAASKANLKRPTPTPASPSEDRASRSINLPDTIDVIGICASTGGPPVLREIFSALPKSFPLPILLVQHISQGFEEGFARWLTDTTGQSAKMVVEGQKLEPGIWLAPNGTHLTVKGGSRVTLPPRMPADIHCPSGNPLFETLAKHSGSRAAGVLLTGMGDDGATGLLSLKQAGGTTIIQDEASSLIWGMPKCGKQLNAASLELHPRDIAALLSRLGVRRQKAT